MAKKTVVDKLEIQPGVGVSVRLGIVIIDGDEEINRQYHRTFVADGDDPAVIMADVNVHLAAMGQPTLDNAGVEYIAKFCQK